MDSQRKCLKKKMKFPVNLCPKCGSANKKGYSKAEETIDDLSPAKFFGKLFKYQNITVIYVGGKIKD